jgi:hypothetical protein
VYHATLRCPELNAISKLDVELRERETAMKGAVEGGSDGVV